MQFTKSKELHYSINCGIILSLCVALNYFCISELQAEANVAKPSESKNEKVVEAAKVGTHQTDDLMTKLPEVRLRVLEESRSPVLTKGDPGTEDNKYGFEGGCVIKLEGTYHLFTAEMFEDHFWWRMRLAHWTSKDGEKWTRLPTLYESSGEPTGQDIRGSLWAPMPIFDEEEGIWNLFYVAYRTPTTKKSWDGRIWRAVSTKPGREGIFGPWKDIGFVMELGPESDPWESQQGTNSAYVYRVGDRWLMLYGSSNAKDWWKVGLAESRKLAGPWKRLSALNPLEMNGDGGTENPIVTRLPSGRYVAVFDVIKETRAVTGYADSPDGIHWSRAAHLELDPSVSTWCKDLRTPLGLIPEDDGTYTLFFTAHGADAHGRSTFASLGKIRVAIE